MAGGDLEAEIVDDRGGGDAEPVTDEGMVDREAAALGGAVGKILRALDFAADATTGVGIAGGEGVLFVGLMVELGGAFGAAGAGGVEAAVGSGDGGEGGGGDVRPLFGGFVFVLDGPGDESAVSAEGAVGGDSGLLAAEAGSGGRGDFRALGVGDFVLGKKGNVAVPEVGSRTGNEVKKAAGGSAGFRADGDAGEPELLDHFEADGDSIAAGGFVAVIEAVDLNTVVAGADAAEGEAAITEGGAGAGHGSLGAGTGGGGGAGGGEDEVEVVAAAGGSFFNALVAERGGGGGGGDVDRVGFFSDLELAGDTGWKQVEAHGNDLADRDGKGLDADVAEARG